MTHHVIDLMSEPGTSPVEVWLTQDEARDAAARLNAAQRAAGALPGFGVIPGPSRRPWAALDARGRVLRVVSVESAEVLLRTVPNARGARPATRAEFDAYDGA